jgi:C4-dicarboxylate transporter DctM subunit
MSPEIIGLLGLIALLVLLASGMWIAVATTVVGLVGTLIIMGPSQAISIAQQIPYQQITNYSLITVPMFVLMGTIISETGIGSDMYNTTNKWIGHMRGGLASATVGACGMLGAVTAGSFSSIAIMSKIARPEMKIFKYDDTLISGCIASGSSLSSLIPPSFMMVLYGIMTEQPIGKLFVSGIIPVILQVVLYVGMIYILCTINPKLGPAGQKFAMSERVKSLGKLWPIIALFVLVIGGIYGGLFTATEAGALGAAGAVAISVLKRQLTFKTFVKCVVEAGIMSGWIMFMIIGVLFFQFFMTVSKLPFLLGNFIAGLNVSWILIMIGIGVVYIILGCFLPGPSMIVLTIPILFPIIMSLGLDPIWFGVIVIKFMGIGEITPPIGMNCFILAGTSGIPLGTIFKGIIPFLVTDIIHVALLIAFPAISLFLVSMM